MSQTVETSPQSASIPGILAGGALLAAFLVGGPALLFYYTTPPRSIARVTPTTQPVVAAPPAVADPPKPAAVAPAPAVVATAPPPSPPPAVVPADPAEDRLKRGWDLLAHWKYDEAKAVFHPLTTGPRPNASALHGYALCVWKTDRDKSPALSAITRAAELSAKDAHLIYNAAAMHLPDAPDTAASLLRAYMADPSNPLNEPMQNLLGLAISRIDVTKRSPIQAFYADYDRRLEAGKTQRRWGSQWLDADEVDEKWAKLNTALTTAAAAAKEHRQAMTAANVEGFRLLEVMTTGTDAEIAAAKAAMQRARQVEAGARERLDQANQALQASQPPFPQKAEPIIPPRP